MGVGANAANARPESRSGGGSRRRNKPVGKVQTFRSGATASHTAAVRAEGFMFAMSPFFRNRLLTHFSTICRSP